MMLWGLSESFKMSFKIKQVDGIFTTKQAQWQQVLVS